jgi:hypothetical protein
MESYPEEKNFQSFILSNFENSVKAEVQLLPGHAG